MRTFFVLLAWGMIGGSLSWGCTGDEIAGVVGDADVFPQIIPFPPERVRPSFLPSDSSDASPQIIPFPPERIEASLLYPEPSFVEQKYYTYTPLDKPGEVRSLYYEVSGNPEGEKVVFLVGLGEPVLREYHRLFDPAKYHIHVLAYQGYKNDSSSNTSVDLEQVTFSEIALDTIDFVTTFFGQQGFHLVSYGLGARSAVNVPKAPSLSLKSITLISPLLGTHVELRQFRDPSQEIKTRFPNAWSLVRPYLACDSMDQEIFVERSQEIVLKQQQAFSLWWRTLTTGKDIEEGEELPSLDISEGGAASWLGYVRYYYLTRWDRWLVTSYQLESDSIYHRVNYPVLVMRNSKASWQGVSDQLFNNIFGSEHVMFQDVATPNSASQPMGDDTFERTLVTHFDSLVSGDEADEIEESESDSQASGHFIASGWSLFRSFLSAVFSSGT